MMNQETKPGYEPNRIPASVFATTMTSKQEWSTQSNESLFSIHMGDYSSMYKSGELCNFEYSATVLNNNKNIGNKISLSEARTKEIDIPVVETGPKTDNRDAPKPDIPQQIPVSPTKSYQSETSNNSVASFVFPILSDYQQNRKTKLNMKSESGKTDKSRPDSKHGLYLNDRKPAGGGGWLSCIFCFAVKD